MLRRRLGFLTAAIVLTPIFVLQLVKNPDLSGEQILVEQVAELRERLRHAEMLNRERKGEVMFLSKGFNTLAQLPNQTYSVQLSPETSSMLRNRSIPPDLYLPTIYSYMPHLLSSSASTSPSFKLSADRSGVDMVLGVPTVKREVQSYLMTTLKNLVDSMTKSEADRCLIVVFIAEADQSYVNLVASQIEKKFLHQLSSGLIEVIAPPESFYPDFNKLKITLGDSPERVKWRTKQNLDYAFLMMYSQPKGTFYVQLEDDIQTKKGFIRTMMNFALQKSAENKDWIVLDFCQLGFIGKMFKCAELPYLVQFFIMFYNDKPVDWLMDYMVQTKVCSLDNDAKTCKKSKDSVWLHYKPSIFQHIGTHSSLKGKVQKLKDKQYGKVQLHFPHNNPPAKVETNIKAYKSYSLERAYKGETYFWGLLPQPGDSLQFTFDSPINIAHYLFRSGNLEHPSDKFYNTTIEVLPAVPPSYTKYKMTHDKFYIIGHFDEVGLAEGKDVPLGKIQKLRISVHEESENWAILCEIEIKPGSNR